MFYLKTFQMALMEFVRSVRADLGPTVDLVDGSVTRSLAEAVAFQAADLSERQERAIMAAIPESTFQAFGFERGAAGYAQGTLEFFAPVPARDPVLIPVGSEAISNDEQVFATTEDAWLLPGQASVLVPATALTAGAAGNIPPLTITRMGFGIPGIQGVRNPQPFMGGKDTEGVDAQQQRFAQYVAALHRSGKEGVKDAMLKAEAGGARLLDALVIDRDDDPGIPPAYLVACSYRPGGVGTELQSAVRASVRAARAGGVVVVHEWTTGTKVNVVVGVRVPDPTLAMQARIAAEYATIRYFAGLRYGEKVSVENLITAVTTAHVGIEEAKVLTPTGGDVPCAPRAHLELGQLTMTGDA